MYWVAVALVDSLLTAMVRANGDALVMHVGEKPIVVAGSKTIDLSTHGLNLGAMMGMLGQLLPQEARSSLEEFGAVEHSLPSRDNDRFTVVAARSGDDIWIEIRRRRDKVPDRGGDAPALASETTEGSAAVSGAERPEGTTPGQGPAASALPVPNSEPVSEASVGSPAVPQGPNALADVPQPMMPLPPEGAEAPPATEAGMDPVREGTAEALAHDSAVAPRHEQGPADPAMPQLPDGPAGSEQAGLQSATHDSTEAADEPPTAVADGAVAVTAAQDPPEIPSQEPVPAMAAAGSSTSFVDTPISTSKPPMDVPHSGQPTSAGFPTAPGPLPGSPAPLMPSTDVPSQPTSGIPSNDTGTGAASVTRTVRIEVPSRSANLRASATDRLLKTANAQGASELFLMSQARPYLRVEGDIRVLADEAPLQIADLESILADLTPEPWRDAVRRGDTAEWLMEFAEVGRVRCATFRDHRGPGVIFHFSSTRPATADQLGLDATLRMMATEPDGLVVVAGPSGSDKSAVVAAFVDIINRHRSAYVITLEPHVQAAHDNQQALISQREVGADAGRSVAMARAALRENPDVLVLEDVATGDLASLALDAANDGRLVVVSLEVGSTFEALQRLLDLVPADGHPAARAAMASSFRGAVAQVMLRRAKGGRVAAREVLGATGAVTRVIADGNLQDLPMTIEAGRAAGMASMRDALVGVVQSGTVDVREAFRRSPDPDGLVAALKAAGVDTAVVDRLR